MGVGKRDLFLDRLRVAATCGVVLLHTVTGAMDHADMSAYEAERRFFLLVMDMASWCVPMFLMISGYLFLNPERELTLQKMLTRYCRRVALALFLFGAPYACLEQIAMERAFRPAMIGKGFLMVLRGKSWSHMWYLYLIFFLYLLTPAMRMLLSRLSRPGVYGLLAALFLASSIFPFVMKLAEGEGLPPALFDHMIYLFYYLCGYLFATGGKLRRVREAGQTGALHHGGGAADGSPAWQKRPSALHRGGGAADGDLTWRKRLTVLHHGGGATDGSPAWQKRPSALRCGGERLTTARLWLGLAAGTAVAMGCSRLAGFSLQMGYAYPFTAALSLLLFAFAWKCSARNRRADGEGTGWRDSGGFQEEERARGGGTAGDFRRRKGSAAGKNTGFWESASALSFGVYLVHPVFLNLYYKFFHVTPLSFSVGISLPLFFLGALLPAAVAAYAMRRIPLLRKYVL